MFNTGNRIMSNQGLPVSVVSQANNSGGSPPAKTIQLEELEEIVTGLVKKSLKQVDQG